LIYGDCRARDGLRAYKSSLWNGGDGSGNIPIHVRNVVNGRVLVDDRRVVNVRDGSRVDSGVADIDPVNVFAAHSIGRHVDFAWSQREPADVSAEAGTSADENDQRRRVDWGDLHGSGYPAPSPIDR